MNYIFNSSIEGIEESDLILLIGCNPRHEATMVNARIGKAYRQNKTPIYSIGNPGDLTYEYKVIGDNSEDIRQIINNEHEISKKILSSKKLIIIIGESALEMKNGKFIFEEVKDYLIKNNLITELWNPLNILVQNSSTVGAIDLKLMSYTEDNNFIFLIN